MRQRVRPLIQYLALRAALRHAALALWLPREALRVLGSLSAGLMCIASRQDAAYPSLRTLHPSSQQ